jgi:hypothetical protein
MKRLMPSRRRNLGQSTIEYLMVLLFGVIVLITGTDPPIQKLALAIRGYYTDYTFALSISSMPNCFKTASVSGAGMAASATLDMCVDLKDPSWPIDTSFSY